MFYDPRENPRPEPLSHNPFNALVAPRPIAWVSSVDAGGGVNLAPFSFYNAISSDPPYIMIALGAKDAAQTPKDTLSNVRDVPEFVVSVASWEQRKQMNQTSKPYAADISEFEQAGVSEAASKFVQPPRVAEAKAAMECRVHQIIELPGPTRSRQRHMVIGEVIGIHIDDGVIANGKVQADRLRQLSRLGYFEYHVIDDTFTMLRPGR